MSTVPAESVVAKTDVVEPLAFHVVNVPASGSQNNVLLLPKELDEKVARMHFSVQKRTAEQQCCMKWSSDSFSQSFLCRSHEGYMSHCAEYYSIQPQRRRLFVMSQRNVCYIVFSSRHRAQIDCRREGDCS